MIEVTTIGIDIAKSVFQLHGINAAVEVVIAKQLTRGRILAFFEKLPPCLVGIEACPTSHHWARELTKLGHDVRLMPANYVKAYVKRSKNDANLPFTWAPIKQPYNAGKEQKASRVPLTLQNPQALTLAT